MNEIAFDLGFIKIYWYSILILTGIIIAYFFARKLAKEKNISMQHFDNLVFYGLIISIISTRLYYVIFNWEDYAFDILKIINTRDGGLAIHGGIIGAFVWTFYYCRKHKINMWDAFDIGATGFLIAQSIGRWGNFTNQEAHGPEVAKSFLENLHLPNFIIEGMNIGGMYYHPTFLYESVWNFIGFLIAFFGRRVLFKRKGDVFCFFIIWYSTARLFIEQLRTDSLMLGDFKVAQLVSIFGIVFGIILLIKKSNEKNEYKLKISTSILFNEGKILLIKKPTNRYSMPGGKIEHYEIPIRTAKREFFEETGLKLKHITLKVIADVRYKEKDLEMYIFYSEEYTGNLKTFSEEGSLEWIKIEELKDLEMYPSDLEIIEYCLNHHELVHKTFIH
ncbi:MAG: prolipoprotein diacylglyceryl transferase [Bacilli bacterium]